MTTLDLRTASPQALQQWLDSQVLAGIFTPAEARTYLPTYQPPALALTDGLTRGRTEAADETGHAADAGREGKRPR